MGRWAERSLNREKIAAMLFLAQSDPRLATQTKTWDQDPWSLNFENGTVDLRTGELRPHDKSDFITKLVDARYTPELIGPRWSRFITETFGELDDWIQKAVGYSLTGITSEKVSFFLWGITDTGKSTFLATLRELFHDYSSLLQVDTLMASKSADNNVAADLADLRGARFAITSETEEGQRLREAKLKRITQGMGSIKSCRKYENPVVFPETHKLWLDCNHAPMISGTDDAIWNRVIPIPCTHQVSKRDTELKQKLLSERDVIAAWVVKGAIRWHQEGLGCPEIILRTRQQWREQMDTIGHFLRECCVEDKQATVRASQLYNAFKLWAQLQGHQHILTSTAFGLRLVERGYVKEHDMHGWFYWGIRCSS
jgi:putative DNA primase/helicase